MEDYSQYQRGLKKRHVNLIALGGIIGSSYFLGTGYVLNQVGPAAFLAYALGGIITYLTMCCLAELTTSVPLDGSFVSYAAKYISPHWACGVGWSYWVSWIVYIPSECIAGGIIMHTFLPHIPVFAWAGVFGLLITIINMMHVKAFGELEFWLALIKISLLVGFSILAILIFFGHIGTTPSGEILGGKFIYGDGGLFPNGYTILFMNMVILLSNFQGSEIIGLTASEAHDPLKSIPSALTKVTYRIVGLYLIPTLLLAMIFPWQSSNIASGSVFATALEKYGLSKLGSIFSFLIIAGAISCANSGLYATVRSLHGLALHDMGPQFLKKMNKHGLPLYASLVSVSGVWFMLLLSYFFKAHQIYTYLLAISGFTGSICWISICWSQYRFRKDYVEKGKGPQLFYHMKGFPYLTLASIFIQVICLFVVLFSPDLRLSFYLGAPVVLVPIIAHYFYRKGKRKLF